jgi:pathogenesis-related protein 1
MSLRTRSSTALYPAPEDNVPAFCQTACVKWHGVGTWLLIAFMTGCSSAESPDVGGGEETGLFAGTVAAHNALRSAVGSPALGWSTKLANFAQNWADTLAGTNCGSIGHSGGRYGENVAAFGSSGKAPVTAPQEVVEYWAAEKSCWSYGRFGRTDQCDMTCAIALKSNGCGHYTQVVWSTTTRVGCGRATCSVRGANWEYWVCSYDPPGNIADQTPY